MSRNATSIACVSVLELTPHELQCSLESYVHPGIMVLHGESITDQASPRTPTQRTFQPQEAVLPQRNKTILQADTPAQKANYSYKWSHCIRVTLHCNCKCRSEACAC